jgi:nicotinamidase-related amidase
VKADALLVIDLQTALLAGCHDATGLLTRVAALADRARAAGTPVVYLRQLFGDDPLLPIDPAVSPAPGDLVLDKRSADSFLGTDLDALLHHHGARTLAITGLATEYCVDSTARAALSRGYDVILAADGHTTGAAPPGTTPTATDVITILNTALADIIYLDRHVEVTLTADITFTEPANPA